MGAGALRRGAAVALAQAPEEQLEELARALPPDVREKVLGTLLQMQAASELPAKVGNTLRECGGNMYLVFRYAYGRQLPLEAVAAAGREVLKKFTNFQPASGEDVFLVREAAGEAPVGPRVVDPVKPFWAVLSPGEDGTSTITVIVSHQEADAFSLAAFVQAWASQYSGEPFPEPAYDYMGVEDLLDTTISPEIPKDAGFMSAADFKLNGPPILGVGARVDLSRGMLDPLRKRMVAAAGANSAADFSLNTFRMALVWKAFVTARKADKDETTWLCWALNVRKRVPISEQYIGNGAINSPIVPMRVEDLINLPLVQLAQLLHKAVNASVTSESILFTMSKIKAHLATVGPVIPRQRLGMLNPNQCSILYSDWSGFDLNPAFEGSKADRVVHMFGEGKPCPTGIAANNPDGLYIGLMPEEVEDFRLAVSSILA